VATTWVSAKRGGEGPAKTFPGRFSSERMLAQRPALGNRASRPRLAPYNFVVWGLYWLFKSAFRFTWLLLNT
jgi:hypothetical protein